MAVNSYGWAAPQNLKDVKNKFNQDRGAASNAQGRQMALASSASSRFGMDNPGVTQPYGMGVNPMAQNMGGSPFGTGQYPVGPGSAPMPPGSNISGNLGNTTKYQTPMEYNPISNTNDMIQKWAKSGASDPSQYRENDNIRQWHEYTNSYMVPFINAELAQRTQGMNEQFGTWDRNEQQRLNTHQMGLAGNADLRENQALNFGMESNRRDFTEGQRQFDTSFGLEQEMGRGRLSLDQEMGRGRLSLDQEMGRGNLALQQQIANNQNSIAQEQNRIREYESQTGRIDVEGRQRLEDFSNMTARMNVENQMTLGQSQLGLQGRELDMNEAYRRSALQQEAELARERMRNEMIQARYSNFGRATESNARSIRSFY